MPLPVALSNLHVLFMPSWQLCSLVTVVYLCWILVLCLPYHGQRPVFLAVEICAQSCFILQELAHKKAAELAAEARARKQALPSSDDRPLEDLLSFIGTEPAG